MTFYPNTSVVEICSGDNFTLIMTCVTDTGTLVWDRVGGYTKTYTNTIPNNPLSQLGDHITVYVTRVSGSNITSVANITRASLELNETVIQCRDDGGTQLNSERKTLLASGNIHITLYYMYVFNS